MATGAVDANGIWIYGEDDNESTYSALLNKLGNSVSTTVTRLETMSGLTASQKATAQDNLGIGNVLIIAPTVAVSGGSATANSLGEISFTNATNLILDNSLGAGYSNYLVIIRTQGSGVGMDVNFRFRGASGDYSTGYYGAGVGVFYNAAPQSNNAVNNGGNAVIGSHNAGTVPNTSNVSIGLGSGYASITAQVANGSYGGAQLFGYTSPAAVQPTGFRIYPSAGSITGTLKLYALNS